MKVLILLTLVAAARAGFFVQHAPEAGISAHSRPQEVWGNYNFAYNEKPATGSSWRKESGDAGGNTIGSYGLNSANGPVRIANYGAGNRGYGSPTAISEPGTVSSSPVGAYINVPSGPSGPYIGGSGNNVVAPFAAVIAAPGEAGTQAAPGVHAAPFAAAGPAPSGAYARPAPTFAGATRSRGDEYAGVVPAAPLAPTYGRAPANYATSFAGSNPAAPAPSVYRAGPARRAAKGADAAVVAAQVVSGYNVEPAPRVDNITDDATTAAAARAYGFARAAHAAKFGDTHSFTHAARAIGAAPALISANMTDDATDWAAARAYGFARGAYDARLDAAAEATAAPADSTKYGAATAAPPAAAPTPGYGGGSVVPAANFLAATPAPDVYGPIADVSAEYSNGRYK